MPRHPLGSPRKREREPRSIRISPRTRSRRTNGSTPSTRQRTTIRMSVTLSTRWVMDRGVAVVAMFSPHDFVQSGAEARRRPERAQTPRAGPAERAVRGSAGDRPASRQDGTVRPVGRTSRLPPPRRTFCVRRCLGLCHGRRTSLGMWQGRCKHAARRVHRP